jgi:hypothetical protein
MMEKSALAGEGGGCPPTLFHQVTINAVYALAERADTLSLFHLYTYMYSVVILNQFWDL